MARISWLSLGLVIVLIIGATANASTVPALYVLGDSTVDCGTNNYINTTQAFRGNFPPYGRDFFHRPTGRFSNGRVVVDFIAEYAGMPLISPYLEPHADHSHGANFGSGGAGVLVETHQGLVVDLQTQLYQFLHHRAAVTEKHGSAYAEKKFADAVYLISIGSNDYLGGYSGNPQQREKYTPEQFVHAVVTGVVEGIKVLYSSGARKIVVLGLGPVGCLPALRALDETGSCSAPVSALAAGHNEALKAALSQVQQFLPRMTIVQAHFYEWFAERLQHPSNYGYVSGDQPCCGAGPCEGRCGVHELQPEKPGCEPCGNANAYVWWDPFHPSETVHRQFAEVLWNGTLTVVQPVPLQELFQPPDRKVEEDSYADNLDLFAGDPLQQLVSESILKS